MKKITAFSLLVLCVLLLSGCHEQTPPLPEPTPDTVQTESQPEAAEPTSATPTEINEIVLSEDYFFMVRDEETYYQRYLTLYPNSSFYDARTSAEASFGTYTLDEDGRIVAQIAGECCVFRKTEDALVLESGRFALYSDAGSADAVPGDTSASRYVNALKSGIYQLDTADIDFRFGDVLLDIDLTEMTFTLKCFDGSIVCGTLHFEENLLVCTHAGGTMRLSLRASPERICLEKTGASMELGSVSTDQLMFYPSPDGILNYRFCYAENQAQQILPDPRAIPLDSCKHTFRKIYEFRCQTAEDSGGKRCVFSIYHYPQTGMWSFQGASKRTDVTAEESSEGSIVFTLNGNTWNFHREGENLYYDGGSPLIAGIWDAETERQLEQKVPEGALFHVREENYVYDARYVLPNETMDDASAVIRMDTKNRYIKIQCYDGTELEGPYTCEGDYINFPIGVIGPLGPQLVNIELFPSGHCLTVRNEGVHDQWTLQIGPGEIGDSFDFLPSVPYSPDNV